MKRTIETNIESGKTTPSKSIQDTSIQQSLDKSSEQSNSLYIPSKSESQSYRDKIKKRFKLIKEHAGTSLLKGQTLDLHKTMKLLKEENRQIETSINKRTKKFTEYSRTDCYHFFCEESGNDSSNNERPSFSEYIGGANEETCDNNFDNVVQNAPPDILQDFLELAMGDLCWYPQRETTSYAKLKNNVRILSEEGHYVCEQKNISNISILEKRLSLDHPKWFNCEGNLKLVESPSSEHCYRPIISETYTDQLTTEFAVPKDATINESLSSVHVHKPTVIEIHVSQIKFKHHPLFSIEHVFERKLLQLYEEYKEKISSNKLQRIDKKLQFLRNKTLDCGDTEITNHFREIKKLRDLEISESLEYRQLIKHILQTWKVIKKIRKDKAFCNTNVKLIIHKEKTNYEKEVEDLEEKINKITMEIINEKTEEYQEKIRRYKDDLEVWSNDRTSRKPKKPHSDEIDEEETREDVAQILNEAFKPPGEPFITFGIELENEITNKVDNDLENLRRQAVRNTRIYLKILYNEINVCKSKQVTINDTFRCVFEETFSLQIKDIPQNITIQVYEQLNTMMRKKLGDILIDISNLSSLQATHATEKFETEELIHYNHEGVGSGCDMEELYNYNFSVPETGTLHTNGYLTYRITYEQKSEHYIDIADKPTKAYESVLDEEGNLDMSKLMRWTNQAEIDPQNPSNTSLFQYIDTCRKKHSVHESPKKYFRCHPELQRLIFYNSSKVEDNIRFRVLQLRNNNEPEFVGMVVPNRIKEIPANVLTTYQRRIKEEQKKYVLDTEMEQNIDTKMSNGQKYLKQIHIKVFQLCRSIPNNLTYDDIVNEKLLSYFQPDISKPLPALASSTTNDSVIQSTLTMPAKLFVNVVSASNIPNKINLKKPTKSRSNSDTINVQLPSTYVEVTYDDMSLITTSKEGTNPVWEEKMVFPLRTSNIDYMSPNALNGSITINMFMNVLDKNAEKIGPNWLGLIKIPLSAITYNGKMEGSFLLRSPMFLNYEQNLIYLTVKLKVEPNFPKLSINMRELPCSEPPYLQDYLFQWNEAYNENYNQNKFSVFAIDLAGKTVCLTRFIRPLEPPQINTDDFDITQEQCARYVSLIPFTDCNKLYDNIWLTTKEMLKLMIGSVIDHSVALTCFLLALNTEAWLLLGYGLPHGTTAYVLVREYDNNNSPIHYIYDSRTANKHNITDPLCPIQKVFCVINESNIWANVQKTQDINLLQFDFMRRLDWHCLFNNQVTAPTNSIQHKLIYYATNNTQEHEFHIEKKLRRKILKLRKNQKTIWNHYMSNQLKNYIANIECNYILNKYDVSQIRGNEHTHSMHGFIVNLPYINVGSIFEVIKASQIFNSTIPDKEYLFGIHMHWYPNQVLAIWMIVGFILSK